MAWEGLSGSGQDFVPEDLVPRVLSVFCMPMVIRGETRG